MTAASTDTLWDRFLKPVVTALVDRDEIQRQYDSIDWDTETARLSDPQVIYPEYYQKNFHGIEGGYLTKGAAVTYDPITQYVLPPSEVWIREDAIQAIASQPRRILDIGCGTGTLTRMLQAAFPDATVTGLDLSPYMLALAATKAQAENRPIRWRHGLAEATGFPSGSFDLVTAGLLFHETPPATTVAILREAHRLLAPGGQFLTLDGNQTTLHAITWLTEIFEEPHIKAYAAGSLDTWLTAAGFARVTTTPIWGIHQISCGFKALSADTMTPASAIPLPA